MWICRCFYGFSIHRIDWRVSIATLCSLFFRLHGCSEVVTYFRPFRVFCWTHVTVPLFLIQNEEHFGQMWNSNIKKQSGLAFQETFTRKAAMHRKPQFLNNLAGSLNEVIKCSKNTGPPKLMSPSIKTLLLRFSKLFTFQDNKKPLNRAHF